MIAFTVFFFDDTETAQIYTLSLSYALPIFDSKLLLDYTGFSDAAFCLPAESSHTTDRKSTRLDASHNSYAVHCCKKKTNILSDQL